MIAIAFLSFVPSSRRREVNFKMRVVGATKPNAAGAVNNYSSGGSTIRLCVKVDFAR
jgi:hypothetical protein